MFYQSPYTRKIGTLSLVVILLNSLLVFESTTASALNSEDSFKDEAKQRMAHNRPPAPSADVDIDSPSVALVWGISLGITALIAIVISVSCVYCSCCPLYRRRRRNRPVTLQQRQFPMTRQNLAYSYDSSGNLVLLNHPYHISNMATSTVGSQAQMTTTTNFYSPTVEANAPPSYDTITATAPPITSNIR